MARKRSDNKLKPHSDAEIRRMAAASTKRILSRRNEQKTHSILQEVVTVSTTALSTQLDAIPEGLTRVTRVGVDVNYKRLKMRMAMRVAGSPELSNLMRVLIVQDKNQGSGNILLSDVLGTTAQPIVSQLSIVNNQRFKILKDSVHKLTTNGANHTAFLNFRIELKNRKRLFTSVAGDSGKMRLWMFVISDSGVTPHPSVEFESELMFTDP